MRATGWGWFAAWAFAGALGAFTVISMLSIGIFILPFAALVTFLVVRRAPSGPDLFGAVAGIGSIGIVIWALNRDDFEPCTQGPPRAAGGTVVYECGGLNGTPWLLGGLLLITASVVAYSVASSRAS